MCRGSAAAWLLVLSPMGALAAETESTMDAGFRVIPRLSTTPGIYGELWGSYRFAEAPFKLEARMEPAGITTGNGSTFYVLGASLTLAFTTPFVEVGAGASSIVQVVRCSGPGKGCTPGTTLALTETLRVGYEDGTRLEWRSAGTYQSGGWNFDFIEFELHVALSEKFHPFVLLQGGAGVDASSWGLALLGGGFRTGPNELGSPWVLIGVGLSVTEVSLCGGFDCYGDVSTGLALGFGLRWR